MTKEKLKQLEELHKTIKDSSDKLSDAMKEALKMYPMLTVSFLLEPNQNILLITEEKLSLSKINSELHKFRIYIDNITLSTIQSDRKKNIRKIGCGRAYTKIQMEVIVPTEDYVFLMEQIIPSMAHALTIGKGKEN